MKIFSLPTGPFSTNTYILSCPETLDTVIIDPGVGSFNRIVEEIHQSHLKPTAIWLTHTHWDHIGDAAKVKRELSLPIYVHEEDKGNLENPGSDKIPLFVPMIEGATPDHFLKDGQALTVGNITFTVLHTPGHSPGGVCFYSEGEKILISGDTFFKRSIGALNLPTSQAERMWPSLEKIAQLPPDTVAFPGHGPKTTLGEEKWLHKAKQIFG